MLNPLLGDRDEVPPVYDHAIPRTNHGDSNSTLIGGMHNSLNSRSLEHSKMAQFVRYGAYLFLWVIGIRALIGLLMDFSTTLKPLVLAALVASILEWLVQFWEWFFWKAGKLIATLAHKLWVFLRLAIVFLHGGCHGLYTLCFVKREHRRRTSVVKLRSRPYLDELCSWSMLKGRWHGSYAGQNSVLRFIAVCMTLALLIAPMVGLYALMMSNVSAMLSKLSGYKDQLMRVLSFAHDHLNKLPEVMPRPFQNETLHALQRFEGYMGAESLVQRIESYISASLEAIISQTESVAFGTVFFFLYTFLWLFVPMHVNSHALKASTFRILPWRRAKLSAFQDTRSHSFVEGQDEPLTEVQEHLYKVIWHYFLAMVIISAVYAGCVLALLIHLGVDMSGFIAIACFFLGFIPELGAIICTVLPIVLVALEPLKEDPDSGSPLKHGVFHNPFADWSERSIKLSKVLAGMIIIKLAVSNVLTSIVMGRNKILAGEVKHRKGRAETAEGRMEEEVKETHPVIILFAVVIAGEIWGAVGMLISVPVISFLRLAANFWFLLGGPEKEA